MDDDMEDIEAGGDKPGGAGNRRRIQSTDYADYTEERKLIIHRLRRLHRGKKINYPQITQSSQIK
jgi:hypothetical protein